MDPERLSKLESRVGIIEGSVNPLLSKIDTLVDRMTENTIQQAKTESSHKHSLKMMERMQKRQDKEELSLIDLHKEFAEYRPFLKQIPGFAVKAVWFSLAMITISVTALVLVAKMFIGNTPVS